MWSLCSLLKFDTWTSVSRAQPTRLCTELVDPTLNLGLWSDHIPIGAMSVGVDCDSDDHQTFTNHEGDLADNLTKQRQDIDNTIQIAV